MGGGDFSTDHLPFTMPKRKHTLNQEWRNLTFMHWSVDPEKLKVHLPKGLELDTFDGKAYIGVVPFKMKNVRPRRLPSIPLISNFPEFNIRTYVKKDGIQGVFFLTLEAESRITCYHAPKAYGLPYRFSKCKFSNVGDSYNWESVRTNGNLVLSGQTKPIGDPMTAGNGSLEEFLFERYSLYTELKGCLHRAYTHHKKWSFQSANVSLDSNTLTESYDLGIENCLSPELTHYSDGLKVKTWSIEIAERIGTDKDRDFLFLDGDCGLCHRLASFIDRRIAKKATLGYRPNNSEDAIKVIENLSPKMKKADTVYLIRNGKAYIRSSAGIRFLLYMKWYYKMWYPLFWLIPLPIRDVCYRFIARFRHKIFKKPTICSFRID